MSLFVSRMCFIFLGFSEAGREPPLVLYSHPGLIILYSFMQGYVEFYRVCYKKEFSHGGLRIQQIDTIKGKHFFCFLNDPHLSAGAPPVHPHPARSQS